MALTKRIGWIMLLLLFVPAFPVQWAVGGDALFTIAEKAVKTIDRDTPLAGKVVQMAPEFFRQAESDRVLGFSAAFYEAMNAALSSTGVSISAHEQGDKPLRILGRYRVENGKVRMTVRLRQMGMSASTDLSVARVMVPVDDVDPALLRDTLRTTAAALVADLEGKAILLDIARFRVGRAVPLHKGQTMLRIAPAYRDDVRRAVAASKVFGGTSLGAQPKTYTFQPYYQVVAGDVAMQLALLAPDGTATARSSVKLDGAALPAEFLQPYDDGTMEVCIAVEDGGRGSVKPDSRQGRQLFGSLAALLRQNHGVMAKSPPGQGQQCYRRVVLRLRIKRRRTADGYAMMHGALTAEVKDRSGLVLGTRSTTARVHAPGRDLSKLYAQLFSDAAVSAIAADVLVYDGLAE